MTESASTFLAVMFGLGIFAIIVAVGWRSVQHRRILRLQGADGRETIIVAGEDDEISSVVTTTSETAQPAPAPAPSVVVVNTGIADPAPAAGFGRNVAGREPGADAGADLSGRDPRGRAGSSTK